MCVCVFFRVADYEAKNKMGVSNLVSLFGPTMMTVDGDPVSVVLAIGVNVSSSVH